MESVAEPGNQIWCGENDKPYGCLWAI
ncbi:unnamed protein product, partial [Brachionus calyciflorus]